MFELKGCYAFPDVNRDVVRNVSRAVCVRYLRTIGPLTIIKGSVRNSSPAESTRISLED